MAMLGVGAGFPLCESLGGHVGCGCRAKARQVETAQSAELSGESAQSFVRSSRDSIEQFLYFSMVI